MGGQSSLALDNKEYREQHWSRNIKKLFTSVKISDPFAFNPSFVNTVSCVDDSKSPPIYAFTTSDGQIYGVSHILPEIPYKIQLETNEIISTVNFDSNSFLAVSSTKIFLITYKKNGFEIQTYDFQDAYFCEPCADDAFIVISSHCGITIIHLDGTQTNIFPDSSEDKPICFTILDSLIVISTPSALHISSISTQKSTNIIPELGGIHHFCTFLNVWLNLLLQSFLITSKKTK